MPFGNQREVLGSARQLLTPVGTLRCSLQGWPAASALLPPETSSGLPLLPVGQWKQPSPVEHLYHLGIIFAPSYGRLADSCMDRNVEASVRRQAPEPPPATSRSPGTKGVVANVGAPCWRAC